MGKIKKAIITAADFGADFLPATKAMPKEMLPIVDTPVIQFVVEEAIASGIEEILIISGKNKSTIGNHFDRNIHLETLLSDKQECEKLAVLAKSDVPNIHYIRQAYPNGLGDAILHQRQAVDEQDHIIAMMAVVGVDAELVDDLEVVFAPVLEVDEGVVQRRVIVAGEGIDAAQGLGRREHVRRDDLVQQAGEFAVGQLDAVQGLELLAEVALQGGAVANVSTVFILETLQLADETVFDLLFLDSMARICNGLTEWVDG